MTDIDTKPAEIKVGSVVTWRNGGKPDRTKRGPICIGVAHCRVVGFGTSEDGEAAVALKHWLWPGEEIAARLADVYIDDCGCDLCRNANLR